MSEEQPVMELTSCIDVYAQLQSVISEANQKGVPVDKIVTLKSAYMLTEDYTFSTYLDEKGENLLIGGVIATKNPFQAIRVSFMPNPELIKAFAPMYKSFYYNTQLNIKVTPPFFSKADIDLKLVAVPKTETSKMKADIFIIKIQSIDVEKELYQSDLTDEVETIKTTMKETALEIIKKNPFLIGFVGIKNIIIPVVFNSDAEYNRFPEIHNLSLPNTTSLNNLLVKVDVFRPDGKKYSLKVPVFLGEPKLMLLMGQMNQDTINIFRNRNIILDGYLYTNTPTFIPIFITNIETLFDITNTQAQEELKFSTFVNSYIAKNYANDIKILIKTLPLTEEDLLKKGLSLEEIQELLKLTGLLIKEAYTFTRDTLYGLFNTFNMKNYIAEANKLITEVDLEVMLAILLFSDIVDEEVPEYKKMSDVNEALGQMIDKGISIKFSKFKTEFMKRHDITEKRFENIKKNIFDNEGIFILSEEEGDGDVRLTAYAMEYIKSKSENK